ncbi:MAG: allophanate hydrolase subunit 1 [Boseongicola sp. SB0662_bin_57]|nr:allophanate hydrolase subunit 1 [Boseongicola sp. SB0662_bin_57]
MTDAPALLPLGPDGLLVRFADRLSEPANRAALAFRADLESAENPGVVETASSLASVLVRFRPDVVARRALEDEIRTRLAEHDWLRAPLPAGRRLWRVPVAFGGAHGPDLEEASDAAGLAPDAAVEDICAARLRVLALGFSPGQPYLGFLPEHWDIPRKGDVTHQVSRGAVVVAVRQVIPFANAAPTGWRQIGRTAFRGNDPELDPSILLRPGDEMEFLPVGGRVLDRLLEDAPPHGGAERFAIP